MMRKFREIATGLGVAGAALLPMAALSTAAWAADEKPKLDENTGAVDAIIQQGGGGGGAPPPPKK